ncbi:50S ribosomal protein L16 [Candidatus Shapirobacteria bacterium CG03_land_8_20_14_0_80_40_19]|uniref:Large ribosomal subunit protein uL16 n=4 Tax=Candidatus Shapironibacteriota TaxID=1752721 RepID=A0A2M7BDZ3_9BACT|nr:MAG: 50S ribosomal protein L16 [Candidatus Shapirobacteria bacterium CG11_big_fil_rev_8_21_14_0_20_40_12]PIV01322.1 MAG: 50S ribosomal protein L16 [Candidatus Shapirobacteria bacterium CG03_land_8_20_14_0_80_40_19]PJC29198.1 MAG: 50S ribosomal protein L16 [Candidatus Shapirobacteria bacterium CG_4_9_14_0_2_um_filter_40_11]PJC76657.1 MAG: 50S ribosomal protein L16 [Candidatus Shapirobacteria bacterium CG_4_8_14_3_um_filter_39_11]
MLSPKRQKFRKVFRGKNKGFSTRGSSLAFGEFGLKAIGRALISANQIEASRKAISHYTKREGKVWIRIFPHRPITAKGAGVGMGAGKGDVTGYVAVVPPGKMLFELSGISEEVAREAFTRASSKLPIPTKFMKK